MSCDDCPDCPPVVASDCFRAPSRQPLHRWLPVAAALSLLFHGCLLLTIAAIHLPDPEFSGVFDDLILEEYDIGPELLIDYQLDRIEEVSVPGLVDPVEMVGVRWSAGGVPLTMTLPAPLGLPPVHDGMAVVDSQIVVPCPDGFPLQPASFQGRSGATRGRLLREGGGNTLRRLPEPLAAPQAIQSAAVPVRRLVARPAVGVSSPYHPMILEVVPHGRQ